MRKNLILLLEVTLALAALVAGYIFVVGWSVVDTPVAARTLSIPDQPYILYLAPAGTERGQVKDEVMQNRGATPVRSWDAARSAAQNRPLDALLIDEALFETLSETDSAWLQTQFRQGVVIVGFGVEDDLLSQHLDTHLRDSKESDKPIGPTGYRLVSSLILGHPDDVKILSPTEWIKRLVGGETPPSDVQHPMSSSFTTMRGTLNSEEDVDLLSLRVRNAIEDIYQMRVEYQEAVKNLEEK